MIAFFLNFERKDICMDRICSCKYQGYIMLDYIAKIIPVMRAKSTTEFDFQLSAVELSAFILSVCEYKEWKIFIPRCSEIDKQKKLHFEIIGARINPLLLLTKHVHMSLSHCQRKLYWTGRVQRQGNFKTIAVGERERIQFPWNKNQEIFKGWVI